MVKWYSPKSLEEIIDILKTEPTIPYAGGTDLMVQYKTYTGLKPNFDIPIMYLKNAKELSYLQAKDDTIEIGTTTSLSDILKCQFVPEILKMAIAELASPSIRNAATIGGNICNASPAGDTLPPLYLLNCKINLISPECERTIPISMFIKGPKQIVMDENELMTSITIDRLENYKNFYRKIGARKANSLSKLSVAAIARVENNILKDIRIAAGAVSPTVVRNKNAENLLIDMETLEIKNKIAELMEIYKSEINPIDDQRSTAVYRKETTLKLIEQSILSTIEEL